MEFEKKTIIFLILLSAIFGVVYLDEKALGTDENITIDALSKGNFQETINYVKETEITPPYFHLLSSILLKLDNNFLSVKLISVFISALSVLFLFLITKKIQKNKTALFAALLFSFNPLRIFYSQHARVYSILMFLFLVSIYFLLKIQENKDKKKFIIGLILANTMLLYSHYLSFLIILSQIIFLASSNNYKKIMPLITKITIIPGILFLPWALTFFLNTSKVNQVWLSQPNIFDVLYIFYKFFLGINLSALSDFKILGLLFFLLIVLISIKPFLRMSKEFFRFILIFFLFPIIFSILFSFFLVQITNYRYLSFLLPISIMPLAAGISEIKNKRIQKIVLFLILICWSLIYLLYLNFLKYANWPIFFGV